MKILFHQLQLYDSGVAILHQGSHGHCYFSIVHAVTSQNILGSFMVFSKLKIATQSSRKWRLNTTPATWKLYSTLKACPANFHAYHTCHVCHAWPISQRFASHEFTQNQYIKNTIKNPIRKSTNLLHSRHKRVYSDGA